MTFSRRAWLGAAAATTVAPWAPALGRRPYGGTLRISVPWPVTSIDPHDLHDPAAAILGASLFEPLFALDRTGAPYPTLAAALPKQLKSGVLVELRPELKTASGRSLTVADATWSLTRARTRGARGLLFGLGRPRATPGGILLPSGSPTAVARALASPLCALVPRTFSSTKPDGCGAFAAKIRTGRITLRRNQRAARGPAFLSRIVVKHATSIEAALRAFESGDADVGWLGTHLYRPRPDAVAFNAGAFGWIVLRTGTLAGGAWGAPGVAQRLVDALQPAQLSRFGLGKLPNPSGSPRWGGPAGELLVAADSPYLVALAKVLAAALQQPGHEIRVRQQSRAAIAQRRRRSDFLLMLDLVRRVGPGRDGTSLSLQTAANPTLGAVSPSAKRTARQLGRTLPLGVIGEFRIYGAHARSFVGIGAWHLPGVWR